MLFETGRFDEANSKSHILTDPVKFIKIYRFQDVRRAFERIEEYSKRYYLAGYFSYELGYYFERAFFKSKDSFPYPLIDLCVFKKITTFDHRTGRVLSKAKGKLSSGLSGLFADKPGNRDFDVENLKLSFTKPEYLRKISRIKEHIKNGDTYQANFTGKYTFNFSGNAFSFYRDLKERQNVSYGAFCKFGDEYILSLSPELFFKKDGRHIISKPMKGTVKRGINIEEDKRRISELKHSAKESAGNLMIVDLIRNDLGRVCETGSVKVPSLFDIEKYNTLFQMTSAVTGTLKNDTSYFDIFKGFFPGGSVTGAPKIRTMQILKAIENGPRNVYCGALGLIFPGDKAVFNLPIRTISIKGGKGEMGVGGGIVIDSDSEEEYRECLLKAKFLTERYKPFHLIETILWDRKYRLLEEHLKRMRRSAEYFDFAFDRGKVTGQLKNTKKKFKKHRSYRARLLLSKEGDITVEASEIERNGKRAAEPVAISKFRTAPDNPFLYHKTTNRDLYGAEYRRCRAKGYFDVLFLNTKGEVTEGAITNIVIKKNGEYYTPPVSSGLLPGIFRSHLLKNRRVKEKAIFLNDLLNADKVFLCNSVRGLVGVKIKVEV